MWYWNTKRRIDPTQVVKSVSSKQEILDDLIAETGFPLQICLLALRKNDWDIQFTRLWLENNLFNAELECAKTSQQQKMKVEFLFSCGLNEKEVVELLGFATKLEKNLCEKAVAAA